nr:uncharacterized mitochondrial protein AtMg00810-like [Tanacetum cinerariifolium]
MQKDDGIFVSQDKYVADILKKFDFSSVKTASNPIETNKALLKDEEAEDVDVYLYRSMIGSLMYLTASRPDIMFDVYAFSDDLFDNGYGLEMVLVMNLELKLVVSKPVNDVKQIHAVVDGKTVVITKSSVRSDLHFNDEDGITCLSSDEIFENLSLMGHIALAEPFNDVYLAPVHTKKVFTNMKRQNKDFSGKITPLFASMLVLQVVKGEGLGQPFEPQQPSSTAPPSHEEQVTTIASQPQKAHIPRSTATLDEPSPQGTSLEDNTTRSGEDSMAHHDDLTYFEPSTPCDSPLSRGRMPGSDEGRPNIHESMVICTQLSKMVLAMEQSKTTQDLVIKKIYKKVKILEKKQRVRTLGMHLFRIGTSRRKSLDKENVSKQDRNLKTRIEKGDFDDDFDDINDMVDKSMENVEGDIVNAATGVSAASASVTTAGVFISTTKPRTPPTTTTKAFEDEDLTIAQTLVKMKTKKAKEKGVVFSNVEESNKSLEEIQKLYEREHKLINNFVPMDSEVVKDSGKKDDSIQKQAEITQKRPRAKHAEEIVKKQKLKDDTEKEELRAYLDIVPRDDFAINIESLATKYPIVDWMT